MVCSSCGSNEAMYCARCFHSPSGRTAENTVGTQPTAHNKPSTKSCATCEHEGHSCSYCISCSEYHTSKWEPRKTTKPKITRCTASECVEPENADCVGCNYLSS